VLAKMKNSHLDLLQLLKNDLISAGAPTLALTQLEQTQSNAAQRDPDYFLLPQNYESVTKEGLKCYQSSLDGLADPAFWKITQDPAEAKRMRSTAALCALQPLAADRFAPSVAPNPCPCIPHRCARVGKEEVACQLLKLALGHAPLPDEAAARVDAALVLQGGAPGTPGEEERWRLEAAQVR
jgi:hypothetical protein